jgi:ferredoxin
MVKVNSIAEILPDKCVGCTICVRVCPTLAIHMELKLAVVEESLCVGCNNCEQRCPYDAIVMTARPETEFGYITLIDRNQDQEVAELCAKADMHPDQMICYCTGGRAGDVARAMLDGAHNPAEVALASGVKSGCTVGCSASINRLLQAGYGAMEDAPDRGWNWYGPMPTLADIPEHVRHKYNALGYHFDEDESEISSIVKGGPNK